MKEFRKSACIILLFISVQFFGYANNLNVKDFGAKGNGITDDAKAIQSAINAAPPGVTSTIYFPAGNYRIASYTITSNYLENYCLLLRSNLIIKGDGTKTVIRIADHLFGKTDTNANAHLFYGIKINNVHFKNLLIEMNGGNNIVPDHILKNHAAIFIMGGNSVSIKNTTIKNCAGTNMIVIREAGHNAIIENCKLYNGGNYVGIAKPNKNQIDFSFIYCTWDSSIIKNNIIKQQRPEIALSNYTGGIELHGSFSEASGNSIRGCYPAMYITSDVHPLQYVTVKNNQLKECLTGISFWLEYPMNHITISKNTIQLTYSRLLKPGFLCGIYVPNGNVTDYNLKLANAAALNDISITDNSIDALLPDSTKDKTVGMLLHSLQNSIVQGNTIRGMNYAGIFLMGSKWGMSKLDIINNKFVDFKPNNSISGVAGYVVASDTYSSTNKDAPGFKKIAIEKNNFIRNKLTVLTAKRVLRPQGKFLGSFIALPASMINEIKFSNNHFSNAGEKIVSVKTD